MVISLKIKFSFAMACMLSLTSLAQVREIRIFNESAAERIGTARLLKLPDSTIIGSRAVKDSTTFITDTSSSFLVEISSVGSKKITQFIPAGSSPYMYKFRFNAAVNELQNVIVVSRRPLIRQEDDKQIIDAEVLANTSTNAYEVLEKTPGAVVDQDGNVYLNSATPATIQINGREVKLSAADLASLLKSLPANSITKVEILRTPSAKYDASSSGGIVNIVLKKGIKIGTNGSVNAGFFQGRYHTYTAGFNVNRSINKTNTFLSYQFTDRNNYEELNSSRISAASALINQSAYTKYPGRNHYISAGVDWEIRPKWTLAYDTRFTANRSGSNALNKVDVLDLSSSPLATNNSLITNKGDNFYFGHDLSTTYKIDSSGSEWELEFDFDNFRNNNQQDYSNQYLLPFDSISKGLGNITGRKNIFQAETNLVLKLKSGFNIETGGKYVSSKSRNGSEYLIDPNNSGYKTDSFQSNRFKYSEQISSAYFQVGKTYKGFTLKPGLRIERTDIEGKQLYPFDTSLSIRRTDVFPYVFLRHKLFNIMGFSLMGNLVYRRSISRPYYEVLNPYPKYIDQFLYEVGNPRLRPQFTTNYEFNVMADDFPVFAFGINDIKDIFTSVTYSGRLDSSKVLFRTYDNLGTNRELYLRVVGGIPPGGKYFFYAGAQHNFSNYKGLYQGAPLDYKRGSWSFFTYHNFKPWPDLNFTLNGFMRLKG